VCALCPASDCTRTCETRACDYVETCGIHEDWVSPLSHTSICQAKRKDSGLKHVILNEKMDRKAEKKKVDGVPFPFTSREQYVTQPALQCCPLFVVRIPFSRIPFQDSTRNACCLLMLVVPMDG
jgi:hypothetical protein